MLALLAIGSVTYAGGDDREQGYGPDTYQPSMSEADVRERQALIQADLNKAQEVYTNMASDRYRWISTMREMWQKERPEILRKLSLEGIPDIFLSENRRAAIRHQKRDGA